MVERKNFQFINSWNKVFEKSLPPTDSLNFFKIFLQVLVHGIIFLGFCINASTQHNKIISQIEKMWNPNKTFKDL